MLITINDSNGNLCCRAGSPELLCEKCKVKYNERENMFTINQIDSLLYGDRDLTINEVDHLLDAQAEMNLNGSDQSDALELLVTNANYTGQADFLPPPNDGPLELPRTMDQIIQADLEKRKQRDLPKPEARPKTLVTNEPDDDSVTDSEDLLPLPRMIY